MEDEMGGEKHDRKHGQTSPEDIREIFGVFSDKLPGLVKGVVNSVFSEDAARGMGKAAVTYYQELKAGGIPDDTALQMTKDYIGTFTKFGDMFRSGSKGIGPQIKENIREKMREKSRREEEEDND